jgi:solute carrier family 35, member F1/2
MPPADFFLAACDVEGNFLVVKAYEYTTLLSCMLLDAYVHDHLHPCIHKIRWAKHGYGCANRWAIPVCLFFCWVYMRTKYHYTQIIVRSLILGQLLTVYSCNMPRAC